MKEETWAPLPFSKSRGKSEALTARDGNDVAHQMQGTGSGLRTQPEISRVIVHLVCCDGGIVFP